MKLKAITEAKYTGRVDTEKVEALLNVMARAVPFIGYGADVEQLKTDFETAFRNVAGMDWHEWTASRR